MVFDPTPEQQAILEHDPARHAQVLAGPGTGKSTTMVALLDRLIKADATLRVRMLTFTRAATAELAERVADVCEQAEQPSTIHSFAIGVLLMNPGTGGFPEPIRIADTWEHKTVVRETLAPRVGVRVKTVDKLIQEMASNWESLTDEDDPEINALDRTRFRGAWNEHRRVLGYTLLQELPYALRRALHDHDDLDGIDFDLLIVDEYQDLNACDLEAVKLLGEKGGCAIVGTGDDDQSIYSWRKAAPVGIRRFPTDYPGAAEYPLSVTLRCGSRIIEWANYVIQGDPNRPPERAVLDPSPDSPPGDVALLRFPGQAAEAKGIADLVDLLRTKNVAPKDILILTRTDHNRSFSKPIREELEEREIPCSDPSRVLELLAEEDNRRVLEHLRLFVNPNDSIAWAALLHLEKGVGCGLFNYVYERARAAGAPFAVELLAANAQGFNGAPSSGRIAKSLIESVLAWREVHELPEARPSGGWGRWIVDLAEESDTLPALTSEFVDLLLALDGLAAEKQSLERFLGQIEPLGKDLALAQSDGVRIMTMGGSKGLTVRAVIIAGMEDGLVPRPGSDLSEERRILYVAMTRAREYLFCTWAGRRRGPTARAGAPSTERRHYCHFLDAGPVESEPGQAFLGHRISSFTST